MVADALALRAEGERRLDLGAHHLGLAECGAMEVARGRAMDGSIEEAELVGAGRHGYRVYELVP